MPDAFGHLVPFIHFVFVALPLQRNMLYHHLPSHCSAAVAACRRAGQTQRLPLRRRPSCIRKYRHISRGKVGPWGELQYGETAELQ